MTKKAILVLGMHRSGTSALTGALAQLGVTMPKTEMAATAENPKGYFESHAIMSLNDDILASCHSAWDDWRPIHTEKIRTKMARRVAAVVADEYGDAELIAIKDPRICKFADLWLPALAKGYECSIILPYRHPAEVAKSLQTRGMAEALALLLWLRHVLDAEAKTRGLRRVLVYTPDLMTNWRDSLTKIGRGLDLKWPRTLAKAGPDLEAFLDKELIHHSAELELFDRQAILGGWIRSAFMALNGMKRDGESPEHQLALDKVRKALDDADRLFGPAVAHVTGERDNAILAQIEERELAKREVQAREDRIGQMANEKDVLASHNRDLHFENLYLREAVAEKEKAVRHIEEYHEAEIQRAHVQSTEHARSVALLSEELAQTRATSSEQVEVLRKAHMGEITRIEGQLASAVAANRAFIAELTAERDALMRAHAEAVALHEETRSSLTQRCQSLAAEVDRFRTEYDGQLTEQKAISEARIADMQRAYEAERLSDREQWMIVFDRQKAELTALREAQKAEQALWAVKNDEKQRIANENRRIAQDEIRRLETRLAELSERFNRLETENAEHTRTLAVYRTAKPGDFLKWAAQARSRP